MKQNILFIFLLLIAVSCGEDGGIAPGGDTSSACTTACRIFLSNSTSHGGIGLQGFDDLCNTDGNKPTDGSTYKALLAAQTRQYNTPDWPLKPLTTYYRKDLLKITTTNSSGVFTFPFDNAIEPNSTAAYTGVDYYMNMDHSCNDWTVGIGGTLAMRGNSAVTDYYSIADGTSQCNSLLNVYCVEQ